MKRVAMLLSCDSFEKFFGGTLGLDREAYVSSYRNDFAWEYGDGLRRRGHDVFLYLLSYGPPELRRAPGGLNVRFLQLPRWHRIPDALLYRLRKLPRGAQARDWVAFTCYARALRRALTEDRVDLLYLQEFWTPRFDILLRNTVLPVIGADHGAPYDPALVGRLRESLPRASKLVCQTAENLERVRALGGDGVLIPNGVNAEFFTPTSAGNCERPKSVLAVGRLVEEQKRFSDLIRALVMLPDFTLTIIGSGPDGSSLGILARELNVKQRVRFAGFINDRAELRQHYRTCGVFVSSSAWEAVALVMLEAMSCATPVVATRIPSFEALLSDGVNGRLVPVGSPNELASAIREAHTRGKEFGSAARATVTANYSADIFYGQLSDFIEGCPTLVGAGGHR